MEYSPYNPPFIQPQLSPQYQPTSSHIALQQSSSGTHIGVQQFPYDPRQLHPQEQLLLNNVTRNYQEELQQTLNNTGMFSHIYVFLRMYAYAYCYNARIIHHRIILFPHNLKMYKSHIPIRSADVMEGISVLDMDSQQYSFDLSLNQLDSAELAAFGTALSENLSTGLSISDPTKVQTLLNIYIYYLLV